MRQSVRAWIGAALAGAGAATALAAPAPPPQGVPSSLAALAFMDGSCSRLIVADTDRSAGCEAKLVNDIYRNSRSSFVFLVKDWGLVSFYGQDSKAVGDSAVLHVDTIIVTLTTGTPHPRKMAGTGACSYTNPYKGPSYVTCSARAEGKSYEANFVSNGAPPDVTRF
jgi:hypothetical protein